MEAEPGLSGERSKKNASRDAHAFIKKWGLAWKVPLSFVDVEIDGEQVKYAFIKPSDFLKFLISKAPELLMGGCPLDDGQRQLESFWRAYYHTHPTHRLFKESHPERTLSNTFALAIHGDEGRGLRKSNTTLLMFETVLGLGTWSNVVNNKHASACGRCSADEPFRKRMRFDDSGQGSTTDPAGFQMTNLKEHCFLTKFVVAALPRKEPALLDAILLATVQDFNDLFTGGITVDGRQWYAACTGAKGDLKWVQKLGQLQRCFGSQTSIHKEMCHECCAGTAAMPFEDSSHYPLWERTSYTKRPYTVRPVLLHVPFEHQPPNDVDVVDVPHERFLRRDLFHNTKQGVFRYFAASCILLLAKLHYFDLSGQSNARDTLLNRAYSHFRLFCETTRRIPALRSFSLSFFNSPTWNSFGWINCKGSDTAHVLAWIHTMLVGFVNAPLKAEHLPVLKQMMAAASAAREFQRVCYSHNLWLNKECGAYLYKQMHLFVRHYNGCAFLSQHQCQYTGFALTAKFHLLCHEKVEIRYLLQDKNVVWVRNPQMYGCESNEDIVGRLSRLLRRVSARRASSRALELYLVKSKALHRRWKAKQPKKTPVTTLEAPDMMVIE